MGVGEGQERQSNMLYTYHDCDRILAVVLLVAYWLVAWAIMRHYDSHYRR